MQLNVTKILKELEIVGATDAINLINVIMYRNQNLESQKSVMLEALKEIYADAGAKGGLTWDLYELARKAIEFTRK